MRSAFFRMRKAMALLLAICLAQCFVLPAAGAQAPVNGEGAVGGMVRVYLSSLGQRSRVDLTICGSYSLDGTGATALPENSRISVSLNTATGRLSLNRNGETSDMGSDFRLRRHSREGDNGVRISQARVSGNLYPGDVQFKAVKSGGVYRLYVIVHVFIEDYLVGVLPYEMGNSSALEALKAQCVCARTYTVRAMRNGKNRSYDLVDTTNDQVYNGTPSGNARCRQAVEETRGIVAMNGGELTATYYTASNGGQIESVRNIWGYSGYDYIRVKDDPYDYQNPYSQVRSFKVAASGSQTAALGALLTSKAKSVFGADEVTIAGVTAVTPHTPRYGEPSRLYTKLNFDVVAFCDGARRTGTLTFDIFSELEKRLGMSINGDSNELWSVQATETGFTVQARRFGHGTGLSQRGAMRMGDLGYTYDQILDFYFEGCQRVQYAFVRSVLSPLGSGLSREELSVDAPAAVSDRTSAVGIVRLLSPSAEMALRQTASPAGKVIAGIPHGAAVTVHAKTTDWYLISYGELTGFAQGDGIALRGTPDGQAPAASAVAAYGTVQGTSYLNLRKEPGLASPALVQIPGGTVLPLLRLEDEWAYTQYGCQAGYISLNYVSRSDRYTGKAMDADASGAEVVSEAALYLSASLSGYRYRTLPAGAQVQVMYDDGAWSQVYVNGVIGYVLSAYLRMNGRVMRFEPDRPGAGEEYALAVPAASVLNMRREAGMNGEILLTIPRGETVIVTAAGKDWHKVRYHGVEGYCAAGYLSLGLGSDGAESGLKATVTTDSGPLNLRASDSVRSAVLAVIPRGLSVPVLARGEEWCFVSYNGKTGYAMTRYLRFAEEAPAAPISAPTAAPAASAPENAWKPAPVQSTVTYAKVTTPEGSLNLRKKASASAAVMARIPQNEMIEVLTPGDKWTKVSYKSKTGYVMTAFLTFVDVPQPVLTDAMTARVSTPKGSLNLREKPSSGTKVLRTIPRDSYVIVLEYGAKWSRVTYGAVSGYVKSEFLVFERGAWTPRPARVKQSGASLREAAEEKAETLFELPAGDYVLVTAVENGWCQADYEGRTGYVPVGCLEFP